MEQTMEIDIPLLLPGVTEGQDRCVERLARLLSRRDGVQSVHVRRANDVEHIGRKASAGESVDGARLCLHYDPERLTLSQVEELVELAGARVRERFDHEVIAIRAVGAEDTGGRLEAALRALPGVTAASVNLAGQMVRVEFDRRRLDRARIESALREMGAPPVANAGEVAALTPSAESMPTEIAAQESGQQKAERQRAGRPRAHAKPDWFARNRELVWSLVAGALVLLGWWFERTNGLGMVSIGTYLVAYFYGARDNVSHAIRDLRRGRVRFNIDLLMVVAAMGAAALGSWAEGGLLLFLFSLGHALEHYALGRARHAISALAELSPQRATVVRDGVEADVAIEDVRPGDHVVVKPAERIPVDGKVVEGASSVNQAPITGESIPVAKEAGAPVYAGSVNGEGALVIAVTAAIGDRTLDRVIRLVAEAETQKAPTQQFTERFERVFVPVVLVVDVLLIVVPPLLGVWTWGEAFYRGMALLVAASPCALALGTPAAVLAGIAQAARKGVLIKGGAHLETMGTIRILALDKTGTITKGEPEVTDVVPSPGVSAEELLTAAAAVEQRSQHPLARAVLAATSARSLSVPPATAVESVTGKGVRARVGEDLVEVGRLLMFEEGDGMAVPNAVRADVARLEAAGRSTMVARSGAKGAGEGRWLGVIGIADQPRAGVRETLVRLRAAGIKRIVMLTGDNAGVAAAVGNAVGVDEVRAGLLPEDKVRAIRELATEGHVAMIGDGVNDAPALALATIGIAMGGAGTAAALETADVALMSDDLGRLPFAIALSRKSRAVIKQNLWLSLGVIALLVVATTSGVVGIGPAVVVHEGSTLVVIANALRLLWFEVAE